MRLKSTLEWVHFQHMTQWRKRWFQSIIRDSSGLYNAATNYWTTFQ